MVCLHSPVSWRAVCQPQSGAPYELGLPRQTDTYSCARKPRLGTSFLPTQTGTTSLSPCCSGINSMTWSPPLSTFPSPFTRASRCFHLHLEQPAQVKQHRSWQGAREAQGRRPLVVADLRHRLSGRMSSADREASRGLRKWVRPSPRWTLSGKQPWPLVKKPIWACLPPARTCWRYSHLDTRLMAESPSIDTSTGHLGDPRKTHASSRSGRPHRTQ